MQAGPVFFKLVLHDSLKSDHILNQHVASHRLGKVVAVKNEGRRNGTHALVKQPLWCTSTGKTDIVTGTAGTVVHHLPAPLIKTVAVRIR